MPNGWMKTDAAVEAPSLEKVISNLGTMKTVLVAAQ